MSIFDDCNWVCDECGAYGCGDVPECPECGETEYILYKSNGWW